MSLQGAHPLPEREGERANLELLTVFLEEWLGQMVFLKQLEVQPQTGREQPC